MTDWLTGSDGAIMRFIKLEHVWVEFHVPNVRGIGRTGQTGGAIDPKRGMVIALKDICFELREGERLALIGHNGAGKTTMLRLIAGVYAPIRGKISTSGRISTLFNAAPGLNVNGTGRENIVTCGLHLGMRRREIVAKMDEIIEFSELGEYIDLPVRVYSSGMLTRLGFSIATSVDPEILILDEGLATGDAQFAQKASVRMRELIARSSIMVIASHSETLVTDVCNRCILLEHGGIICDGTASSVVDRYRQNVVDAARHGDLDNLHRAYILATNIANNGDEIPLDLWEQAFRYVLQIQPENVEMWRQYAEVVSRQGRPIPPEAEIRLMLDPLAIEQSGIDIDRLSTILNDCPKDEISPEIIAKAEFVIRTNRNIKRK